MLRLYLIKNNKNLLLLSIKVLMALNTNNHIKIIYRRTICFQGVPKIKADLVPLCARCKQSLDKFLCGLIWQAKSLLSLDQNLETCTHVRLHWLLALVSAKKFWYFRHFYKVQKYVIMLGPYKTKLPTETVSSTIFFNSQFTMIKSCELTEHSVWLS